MTFSEYESYKDSEIEWLGEIPSHWGIRKIKSYALVKRGASPRPISDPRYFSDEGEYGWVRIEDVTKSKKYLLETKEYLSALGSSYSVKQHKDDLFLSIAGSVGKPIISKINCCIHDGFVWFNWFNQISREYLFYIFLSGLPFIGLGKHGTQLNLNTATIGDIKIPVPSPEEQNRIVKFLDCKISEIDQAIAQKQRLIELLQEQKAIFINQAVTKGLNPNVPMRDSGIDWIGEIPTHWDVIRNRYLFKEQNERSLNGSEIHLCMSQKLGLIPSDELKEKTLQSESYEGAKLCKKADLVLNRLKAHLGVFSVAPCDGLVSPDYSVFRLQNQDMTPEYFENLFKTNQYISEFNKRVKGIVVGFYRLYTDAFNNIACLCPPEREQVEIRNWVFMVNQEFRVVENAINTEIEKLTELKTVLISNSVTGQIKI